MRDSRQQLIIENRVRDLRENTDFLSTVFENVGGYAIIGADFDGNVIAYNEGARRMYGYTPEEIIGKKRIEVFFPEQFVENGGLRQLIEGLIRNERCCYEGEKVRKNGDIFPAHALFTLTKDKSHNVVGFVEITEDVSELDQMVRHWAHVAEENERRAAELEQARQREQQMKEILALEQLSRSGQTSVTAGLFGAKPLRESGPDTFSGLAQRYGDLMDLALEQRAYRVEHNLREKLRSMASEIGLSRAGPRDVVEIHTAALKGKTSKVARAKAQAYMEEGRLILLELMGYLVSFYRNFSLGFAGVAPPGNQEARTER